MEYAVNPTGYTGKYLVASYDTGNYIKEADFAAASNAYDQAIHNYQYLTALVNAATTEATAASTGTGGLSDKAASLTTAEGTLTSAVSTLQTKANELDNAKIAKSNADTAETYAAQKVKEAKIALYGADGTGEPNAPASASADSLLGKKNAATTALAASTGTDEERFNAELVTWYNEKKSTTGSQAKVINDAYKADNGGSEPAEAEIPGLMTVAALEEFSTWVSGHEGHDFYTLSAANKIAVKKYEDKMTELYGHANGGESGETAGTETGKYTTSSLYGEWKSADATKTSTSNTLGDESDAASSTGSAWAQYKQKLIWKQQRQDMRMHITHGMMHI